MKPGRTNKHGVFVNPEWIEIPLQKNLKSSVAIEVAKGEDDHFYWGHDCKLGFGYGAPSGNCSPCSIRAEKFGTFDEAVLAAASFIKERIEYVKSGKPSDSKKLDKIIEAIDLAMSDYGKGEKETGVTVHHRRLKKAYLIGRAEFFIWRGHYNVNPDLPAWGMDENIEKAFRFESLQACLEFWRSRHNFPERYEHCIWNGYLTFWEETKKGIRRIMPAPEQDELF